MAAFCSCIAAQRALLAAGRRPLATTLHTRMLYTVGNTACQRLALQTAASSSSHVPLHRACAVQLVSSSMHYSTSPAPKASSIEQIKVVLKEYGGVGVVFHTVMSLCSLGSCYLVVSRSDVVHLSSIPIPPFTVTPIPPYSGVDVGKVLEYFNVQSSAASKGASTFALAYVLHKMFLPLRAGITVASVPLIVRWLRAKGWVRGVAKQVQPK